MEYKDDIIYLAVDLSKLESAYIAAETANRYNEAFEGIRGNMVSLNTNRGGKKVEGTSGYVFENVYAYEKNIESMKKGTKEVFSVIDDNSKVDIVKTDAEGKITNIQAKKGYQNNPSQVLKDGYDDIDIFVIDKGNTKVKKTLEKRNLKVEEANFSNKKVDSQTKWMKTEREFTNKLGIDSKNAPISANLYAAGMKIKAANTMGVKAGNKAAALTAGICIGKDIYFLIQGDREIKAVAIDVAKNTVKSGLSAYGTTFATNLLAPLAFDALARIAVFETAKNTILQVGAITAQVSIGVGSVFLVGVALGCAYTGYKLVKLINASNRAYMGQISEYLDQLNATLRNINFYLEEVAEGRIVYEIEIVNQEFSKIHKYLSEDNYSRVSDCLDNVLRAFGGTVAFQSQDEFDDFFYSDDGYIL